VTVSNQKEKAMSVDNLRVVQTFRVDCRNGRFYQAQIFINSRTEKFSFLVEQRQPMLEGNRLAEDCLIRDWESSEAYPAVEYAWSAAQELIRSIMD
jgi:hypothetical protein